MLVLRAALDLLVALLEPLAVALWAVDGEARRLVWSDRIDQCDLEALCRLGEQDRRMLESGGAVFVERPLTWVVPCFRDERLRALLQFRPKPEASEMPHGHLRWLGELMVLDLEQVGSPGGRERKERPTLAERESLLHLLDHQDWNVTRTARVLRVTRTTIYNRMRRFDIPRKRVRVTPRRSPAPEQVAC